ncbi:MAG: membrane protein insertion efficiency factor YidD [Erysipelotrichales bacterium]|nr:membrane protein insertion efficiency factor YidD [Erysipelotrichales bacterium]
MQDSEINYIREVRKKDITNYFVVSLIAIIIIHSVYIPITCLNLLDRTIWIIVTILVAIVTYIFLRRLAIGSILLYKAYAPMSVRDKCRFTPSCSTYMLRSIQKYGLIIGIIKGIRRICRCKPPNGGIDLP